MNPTRSLLLFTLLAALLTACQPAPAVTTAPTALPTPTTPPPAAIPPELPTAGGLEIYAEDTTWENWSWNTQVDRYSANAMHTGYQSLEIIYLEPSAGLSLRSAEPIDPAKYQFLVFWVMVPEGERYIYIFTQGADDNAESAKVAVTVTSQWQEVRIPLADMGGDAPIKRVSIQDNAEGRETQAYPLGPIYVDDLYLIP